MSRARVGLAALASAGALVLLGVFFAGAASAAPTVWLCKPGLADNPCTPGLSTTIYSPTLQPLAVVHPRPARQPRADCFYVYPTVSDQKTPNANFDIDPEERSIALYQAARFSQYCRVFAPVYRQVTLAGAGLAGSTSTPPDRTLGLNDVRAAFRDYLQHYNHGRPFVLIGHSQGTAVLRAMIKTDVDPVRSVRRRLLSALLLGGNVLVKTGSDIGGDFQHIPACHSRWQTGCAVAFSTFDAPVPANSRFGRSSVPGQEVLCTNPGDLRHPTRTARIHTIFPSEPFAPGTTIAAANSILQITVPQPPTVWVSEPFSYVARCSSENGANVLQMTAVGGAQTPHPSPDPTWGLHLLDAQVALGDLVRLVRTESIAYQFRHWWWGA